MWSFYDEKTSHTGNTGFYYVKSNPKTRQVYAALLEVGMK
jgi:hypothetical protein